MDEHENKPRRKVDTSTAEARAVLASALRRFGGWRSDLARFAVRVDRPLTNAEREAMLTRCKTIAAELGEVREALILDLADAPRKVAGHSRVVDVEKALDGIEAQTAELRGRLG